MENKANELLPDELIFLLPLFLMLVYFFLKA